MEKKVVTEEQIAHYRLGAGLAVVDIDVDHELIMNAAEQGIRLAMSIYEPDRRLSEKRIEELEQALKELLPIAIRMQAACGSGAWFDYNNEHDEQDAIEYQAAIERTHALLSTPKQRTVAPMIQEPAFNYNVKFEVTIAGRNSTMSLKTGDMNITSSATIDELNAMPDFNDVVAQLLQNDHPKLRIIMVKVTNISEA